MIQTSTFLNLKWLFTAGLLGAYLLTFAAWRGAEEAAVKTSGWILLVVLGVALVWAYRRMLFVNAWDLFIHAAIVLDLFLESQWIPVHDHNGFVLCAAGFAAVVAGYRRFAG